MEFLPFITNITGNSPLECTPTRPKDEKGKVPKFLEAKEKDPHWFQWDVSTLCTFLCHSLLSRKSLQQSDICSLTFAVFFHLSSQPVLGAVWSSKRRIMKWLPLSWGEIHTQTNWHPHGMESTCLYWLHDVIWVASTSMTSLAKRYSICVSRISKFYLFIKEKGSVVTQLTMDVMYAWGATQNLNFGTSWLLNGFILQNCCNLCKTTKTCHLL